jgi:hypothetical protein
MSKLLLITQIYPGSKDAGGNRVHATVKKTLQSKYAMDVIVLDLSNGEDHLKPNEFFLKIRRSIDVFIHRKAIKDKLNKHDIVICDGIISSLAFILSSWGNFWRYKLIVIHHNNELRLERKIFPRMTYGVLQQAIARVAKLNIYFSKRDSGEIYSRSNNVVCLPILDIDADAYLCHRLNNDLTSTVNNIDRPYYAIPSNFAYYPNIDGLLHFYRHHRNLFSNCRIIISTPALGDISDELNDNVHKYSDDIISIAKYDDYLKFIRDADGVILPIYSGSGIQLKAIDALFMNSNVYSSDMIRKSHAAFEHFNDLSRINNINYIEAMERPNAPSQFNYKLIYINEALDRAIASLL